ncbi:hypothetical protein D9615_005892 [Tricholomella constricta]|uniref:Exonuclease 1 n=1 Tax=Tricholomella constricta TaxID=117010 RepID=A0A8H5H989_9AGAR|nr:hypothetical protein D9615_005892 [Tricholomella constricta]
MGRCDSDGTLITQRFHFAQAPHPYRHVLGWYRLARELKEAGVSAVCVFDGKERNMAKAREAERRKEVQRKTAARGALEHDRSKRLRKLSSILHRFWHLDSAMREQASSLLRQLSMDSEQDAGFESPILKQGEPQRKLPYTFGAPRGPRLPLDDDILTSHFIADEALESTMEDGRLSLFSAAHDAQYYSLEPNLLVSEDPAGTIPPNHPWFQEITSPLSSESVLSPDVEHDVYTHVSSFHVDELHPALPSPEQPPSSLAVESVLTEDDVLNQLATLYLDYRQSVSKLVSLAAPLDPSLPSTPGVGDPDTQAEIVMTKAQYQLMLEEGSFWDTLVAEQEASSIPMEESALVKLSRTSDIMSASFERRMNPPTVQTYNECKEILQAMGVPCLESSGAFEAEALASSIVLNGLADYVASEDTDVLVYEAPLVRNLTNRHVPLTIVSGAEIRTTLQLDRASFVDFALLLGTDFSQRIKNVGPARALKFIREHRSIERVIELEKKYLPRIPHEAYIAQVEIARMVFGTLPPVPEKSLLEQGIIDEAGIIEVLQRYGLGRAVMNDGDWDYYVALEGNYFNDNPSAS